MPAEKMRRGKAPRSRYDIFPEDPSKATLKYYKGDDSKFHVQANSTDANYGLTFGSEDQMERAFIQGVKLKRLSNEEGREIDARFNREIERRWKNNQPWVAGEEGRSLTGRA